MLNCFSEFEADFLRVPRLRKLDALLKMKENRRWVQALNRYQRICTRSLCTVRLTFCFTGLDLTKQANLILIQH